mmetsp:Transcript_45624/g.113338  ORF Transcript_45624/g.113338 Transcript_45624/m.113338 type:complete len:93 (+) Transcript_45624:621-899(+)
MCIMYKSTRPLARLSVCLSVAGSLTAHVHHTTPIHRWAPSLKKMSPRDAIHPSIQPQLRKKHLGGMSILPHSLPPAASSCLVFILYASSSSP